MKLFLARHAQCEKNLIGIPGGPGTHLTKTGRHEAYSLAETIRLFATRPSRIIACPPVQAIETAQIVADVLRSPVEIRGELRSIHLGVLTGIPIAEARERYPASSESMDRWRRGDVELCDVVIEGMENPRDFYCRGLEYLLNYISNKQIELIVATTSILILLENLSEMNGVGRGEGYRAREYNHAELFEINLSSEIHAWLKSQLKHLTVG